jgi:hypothetical protein
MGFELFAVTAGTNFTSQTTQFDWRTIITSALLAAVISALVAIIGQWVTRQNAKLAARIARENARLSANLEIAKTLANSRQEWINLLREDMAQFAGISAKRSRLIIEGDTLEGDEFESMVALSARIRMRLNPNDSDFEELWACMSKCSLEKDPGEQGKATKSFVQVSQRILKREWEVLKQELQELKTSPKIDG